MTSVLANSIVYRAKDHISPGEPYFATFYYNGFQCFEAKFGHFLSCYCNSRAHFERKFVSMKNEEITGDSKWVAKYGHLAKYGSLLYILNAKYIISMKWREARAKLVGWLWFNITFSDISALWWWDSCPVSKFPPAAKHPTPWAARGLQRAKPTPTRAPGRPKMSLISLPSILIETKLLSLTPSWFFVYHLFTHLVTVSPYCGVLITWPFR